MNLHAQRNQTVELMFSGPGRSVYAKGMLLIWNNNSGYTLNLGDGGAINFGEADIEKVVFQANGSPVVMLKPWLALTRKEQEAA